VEYPARPSARWSAPDGAALVSRLRLALPRLLEPLAVFALFALVFGLVQFRQVPFYDNDSYYHMRMAALVREQGLRVDFVWLPLSTLNRETYVNHHLLHHVYLSLFAGDGSPEALVFGGKLAMVVMAGLVGVMLWHLLRSQSVRWPALWAAVLLVSSTGFLFRLSQARAISASLLLQLAAAHLLLQRRYRWLAPLAFLYVWWYDGYPLLFAVVLAYLVAALLSERRFVWQALAWPLAGVAAGLATHPSFPNNLRGSVVSVALENALGLHPGSLGWQPAGPPVALDRPIPVGSEWYRFGSLDEAALLAGVALALCAAGLALLLLRAGPWRSPRAALARLTADRTTLFASLLALGFGALMLKSQRFVEYFPAYAVLLLALACRPYVERLVARPARARAASLIMAAALSLPVPLVWGQFVHAAVDTRAAQFERAALWLRQNVPPGERIFLSIWDSFPWLFFYDTDHTYTLGLDPKYTYNYDPELFVLYDRLARGRVELPGVHIRERFGSRYVVVRAQSRTVVDGKNKRILPGIVKTADADSSMRRVYDQDDIIIYQINAP
jgi:asparagine N-glycosylation enzyme membrane subunit Stt3